MATHLSILAWRIPWRDEAWQANPIDCSRQAPLSMGFSSQEYWSGLPCPSPGDLPNPGIKPGSPALQAYSLPTELLGKPTICEYHPTNKPPTNPAKHNKLHDISDPAGDKTDPPEEEVMYAP